MYLLLTRMHSSRMRNARSLTASYIIRRGEGRACRGGMHVRGWGVWVWVWTEWHACEHITLPQTSFAGGNNPTTRNDLNVKNNLNRWHYRQCLLCFRADSRRLQDSSVSIHRCDRLRELCVQSPGWGCARRLRLGILLQTTPTVTGRS